MSNPPPPPSPDIIGNSGTDYISSFSSPPPNPNLNPNPHHSSKNKLNPSVLIIITILAFTAIASVILCFILRYLNRRCLLRLSAVSSVSSRSSLSIHRVTPQNTAATTAACYTPNSASPVINALPLFSFASITRRPSSTTAADCAVCLSKFESQDQLRLLPLCCHAFHAQCVDTWLQSNQTCPLCRSAIFASESDVIKASMISYAAEENRNNRNSDSFRLEIGSISRRQTETVSDSGETRTRRSYSLGSFEYLVDEDSEVNLNLPHNRRSVSDKEDIEAQNQDLSLAAAEIGGSGRHWLRDYVDRLSNSFRGSGRFFTGSSRRSEAVIAGDWEQETSRVGEEISELFRWFSGV